MVVRGGWYVTQKTGANYESDQLKNYETLDTVLSKEERVLQNLHCLLLQLARQLRGAKQNHLSVADRLLKHSNALVVGFLGDELQGGFGAVFELPVHIKDGGTNVA